MKKIKDIFYEINDIVLILIVILLASLLVYWRINVISDYPKTLAKETDTVKTSVEVEDATKSEKGSNTSLDSTKNGKSDTNSKNNNSKIWKDDELASDIKVDIPEGTAEDATSVLVSLGLFSSNQEFQDICKAIGKDYVNIKSGSFAFTKGMTKEEIATSLTN